MEMLNGVITEKEAELLAQFGLKHLSYSSMRQFCTNELGFQRQFLLGLFQQDIGQSLLVGVCCHTALEEYNVAERNMTEQEMNEIAMEDAFRRIFNAQLSGINAFLSEKKDAKWEKVLPISDAQIPYVDVLNDEMEPVKAENGNIMQRERTWQEKVMWLRETLEERKAMADEDFATWMEYNFMKNCEWLVKKPSDKTEPIDDVRESIMWGIRNFLENVDDKSEEIFAAEMGDTIRFQDIEGYNMPVPIKGKIDLIVVKENGEIVGKDYKFKSKMTDFEKVVVKPDYEMQAYAYRLVIFASLGKLIDRFEFEEIATKKAAPPSLLQAQLNALCEQNGIETGKYDTNAVKTEKLVQAGVLKNAPVSQKIVVDFTNTNRIAPIFHDWYKRIVNRLYMIMATDGKFMPNFFKSYDDEQQAYLDYAEDVMRKI